MSPRPRERRHLGQVGLILGLMYLGLVGHRLQRGDPGLTVAELLAVALFAASAWLLHRALGRLTLRGDEALVPIAVCLSGLGLLIKLRLLHPIGLDQLQGLAVYPLGFGALAAAVWGGRGRLLAREWFAWSCGLAACLGMWLLVREGVHYRGARFGPGLTTPTEALKLLLVVFLAGFLRKRRGLPELLTFAVLWAFAQYLLVRQRDLGMVLILSSVLLSLFYVTTGHSRYLLFGLAMAAMVGVALWYLAPLWQLGHGQERLTTWLDPWSAPQQAGYQTIQALFALRAGGWEGLGLGGGYPDLTPLVESDFVYAALAEELGWLGSGLVLLLYVALLRRTFRIAALAREPFRQRLATGCATLLAIQTLINVGGVVRLLPITGITLPFISHGGSSLLVCCALLGLVLAVGHHLEAGESATRPRREPEGLPLAPDGRLPQPRYSSAN